MNMMVLNIISFSSNIYISFWMAPVQDKPMELFKSWF